MMWRVLTIVVAALISNQLKAFSWSDLWFTPNQQAQHLMEKGQFAKAKDLFERNDWAASAAYRAGDYEQAAKLFNELKTEQGYYNQGNALAHLGKYEEAIRAYDKALAFNPNNQDALYNRKLISELLKKDKEKKKSQNQQDKDQQNQDKQNQDKQNQDKQNKDQQNQDQQNQDKQNKDQQNQDQQNQGKQNKDQQNQDQQNQDKQNKNQQNQDQQNKDTQNKDQQNQDQQNQDKQNQAQQNKDQNKKNDKQEGEIQSESNQEKQLAKEQWLRLIPDDPGGLMREKFLRDHLRRERGWYQ
ncbi:Predicted O-linked N-acetylglucosamine transferase%2C SPINDLY family [Legionella pneumophila]|uniref:tetratricopeptide repeat protein n=1 Tax=Legionella pneumophila TaxID=446 RepID=UPI0005CAEB15|nr:tetratricopeptide repeat protein [Legionella pneumophila]HAT8828584.1 tetratricopeptide repeat protein [Legionella pneumophila subsp. pneumophila]WAI79067.1 tetratricopeptide repeat protein [Legionella pneumophila]CZH25841.1 Predicted O-linked N-acetylglucosamine transferase%2C SPINDLY family [Legionella pneumophila]CZI47293.1 Predicted O-linked N-acetylglucosamine transferase%2C SPINDLY family [Legionella pneumophila]HAT4693723.1 tetratricopeptide repeat protein [Legionella pneumophila]